MAVFSSQEKSMIRTWSGVWWCAHDRGRSALQLLAVAGEAEAHTWARDHCPDDPFFQSITNSQMQEAGLVIDHLLVPLFR
jgi:hypothetical protein